MPKIRTIWHIHLPIIPFWDKDNRILIRNIRNYLRFLKKNKIGAFGTTFHSHLHCRNKDVVATEIDFMRLNLPQIEIFRLVKKEAGKVGIIAIPSLEIEAIVMKDGKQIGLAHLIVMHEDENVVFDESLYRAGVTLEELLPTISKECLLVLAHPWRFEYGYTFFAGPEKSRGLIEKYGLLVELNGWILPYYYGLYSAISRFPYLRRVSFINSWFSLAEKNFRLEGINNYPKILGLDAHARHLLPGKTGYVEYDVTEDVDAGEILMLAKDAKGVCFFPSRLGFIRSMFWVLRGVRRAFVDEVILSRRLKKRNLA